MRRGISMLLVVLSCQLACTAWAGTADHKYKKGEHVELWVNKVGPYANPQEAYEYYKLPYCAPDTKHHPDKDKNAKFNEYALQSLGEHLSGHSLRHSGHDVVFGDTDKTEQCVTEPLTESQAQQFSQAIQHRWFYQFFLDDLPVWGMVGELLTKDGRANIHVKDDLHRLDEMEDVADLGDLQPYIYTNRNLIIKYNKDQIVQVDIMSDPTSLEPVKAGKSLTFSLHIAFQETGEQFHTRFDRYLDHEFFKHPIHWFSIFNSFMMVIFLLGLVSLILLRTLKKDYAKYGLIGDLDDSERDGLLEDGDDKKSSDDTGWKQVHGDVFRAPVFLPFFAAIVGTGSQLVVLTTFVILFAVLGPLHGEVHEERGEVLHAVITVYSLSSIIAGYTSGQYFKMYYPTTAAARRNAKTSLWQIVMGMTVLLMPTILFGVLSILNTVSLVYGTINSIPFLVILKLFLIYVFVSVPLCVVGTILGRRSSDKPNDNFPCRVNAIPRPIPDDVPWYGTPTGLIPLAGLLSFGSIFIELYYVLTSLWNYKFYHVYGFLMGVFGILVVVVSMTSIIVVYFLLNAENYNWQWTAFGSGASTAGYVFLYGVYYFMFKTQMHGFLQICYYFGYMGLLAISLGLLCGVIGHGAASKFVRTIFKNVKVD